MTFITEFTIQLIKIMYFVFGNNTVKTKIEIAATLS